jgi:hypothetical protein
MVANTFGQDVIIIGLNGREMGRSISFGCENMLIMDV